MPTISLSHRRQIAFIAVAAIVTIAYHAGCSSKKGPSVSAIKQARHEAALDISKNSEYQAIREWLISQDLTKWPPTSDDALKLQAELDIALLACRKLGYSEYTNPTIVSLPTNAAYSDFGLYREIPKDLAAHGQATITGNLSTQSREPDKQLDITLLGSTMASAISGGMGMTVASTGKISRPKGLYTNTAMQGVLASMIVESPTNNSLLYSTMLPRDRIIMFMPSPLSREFEMLIPTAPGSIFGIRGTVSGFFPGISIRSDDNKPIWFALTKEMGLIYLVGKGRVIDASVKQSDVILGGE